MKKKEPINLKKLRDIVGDDNDTILECFNDFLLIFPEKLSDLKKILKKNNNIKLVNSTHSFKNVLRYISADNAADVVQKIEEYSEKKDKENIEILFGELEKEIDRVNQFILDFISHHFKNSKESA